MTIRLRLALWYSGLAGVVLAAVLLAAFLSHSGALADEVDSQLRAAAEHVAPALNHGRDNTTGATSSNLQPVSDFTDAEIWLRYFNAAGTPVAASTNAGGRPVLFAPLAGLTTDIYVDGRDGAEPLRGYIMPISRAGQPAGYLVAATSLAAIDQLNRRFALLLAAISLGGLLLTAGAGWAIAGGALRPVSAIIAAAQAITTTRAFSRRLPAPPRRDELGRLTSTLNAMLGSLEAAYAAQRRFVDDAAHELRAPLTIVQGNLALLRDPTALDAAERTQVLADLDAEVLRLSRLINALLALARADAGQQGRQARVELDVVLTSVYGRLQALAAPVTLHIAALEPLCVVGDADRLEQLLLALGENAVRYTPAGGRVELRLERDGDSAVLSVADTGIGISPADLPHIFERFYRGEDARTLSHDGTGLGLPIVRWIVEMHGGTLAVESTPGQGSRFTVRLPVIPCDPPASADS